MSSPIESTEDQEVVPTHNPFVDDQDIFVGKKFTSFQEAETFYQKYAADNGFSIRKKSTDKTDRGHSNPTSVRFTCCCEGTYVPKKNGEEDNSTKRRTSTIKTGCKARMRVKKIKDSNLWKVNVFYDLHNHVLVSPSKRIHMRSNRYLPEVAKTLAESFSQEHLQINKIPTLFGGCSNTQFDAKDLYNHLRYVRENINGCGDADSVRAYFQLMGRGNKDFYYAIDTDKEGRAVNFFWLDGRSRLAYQQFGDVVTFDTTYNTNKYSMPFGPFTGVNHHRQSILFGCALIGNECEETFVWVFEHWLQAMEGKYPISIITDQDRAITNAVRKIFPKTRHRYCLWHITKKFTEKFKHIYFEKSSFKIAVKRCINDTKTVEEFEDQWKYLVHEYNLEDHDWIKEIYEIRHCWIPIYCRNTFFAGMNTTQRSESINSFFDSFVTAQTTLKEFVAKYDQALESIYVKERKEDYVSIYKQRILKNKDDFLVHAASIYTRNMFFKFEEEFSEACRLRVDETGKNGEFQTYLVCYKNEDKGKYVVNMNLGTMEGACECQLFEFLGIACKHLCRVFDILYLNEIPSYFILKRWKKNANRIEIISREGRIMQDPYIGERAARASYLLKSATQCAYMASASDEGFTLCMETLHQLFEKLRVLDDSLLQIENGLESSIDPVKMDCMNRAEGLLLDPYVSQTKGRKKGNEVHDAKYSRNERIKSGLEKATQRKKARVCQMCKGIDVGHDSRNCPKNSKSVFEDKQPRKTGWSDAVDLQ